MDNQRQAGQIPGELQAYQDEFVAHARADDPDTSHEAADLVENARLLCAAGWLLDELNGGDFTDWELWDRYEDHGEGSVQTPDGLRSARNRLKKLKFVRDSGLRRPSPYGRKAIIWTCKPLIEAE